MSVAYLQEYKKAYSSFRSTGRENGATCVHRAFSNGYQGESIEYSLMDPEREGGAQNAQQYVRPETHMLALRV